MSLCVWLPLNGNLKNQGLGKFNTDLVQNNLTYEPRKNRK